MSGPQYPPGPQPGSNAIGSFIIGVSPIGDITPFDVWETILFQYANSPILARLCTDTGQYADPTTNFDSFFDTIWNVDTAVGYGLDVWGRIVNVSRTIEVSADAEYFGFAEGLPSWQGWDQAPFYFGQPTTSNFTLTDTAYRLLILTKALANICDGSIPTINQLLLDLFPNRGNCYVVDNQDMTMVYQFDFVLSPFEVSIVNLSGVLPKPVGVSTTVRSL